MDPSSTKRKAEVGEDDGRSKKTRPSRAAETSVEQSYVLGLIALGC